jgi:hypothetical protein
MTQYLKVLWHHEFPDEPVELYSEIDDSGAEIRTVEIYRDGRSDYADSTRSTGTTTLSETRMPSIEEISAQAEFSPEVSGVEEFELVWRRAVSEHT